MAANYLYWWWKKSLDVKTIKEINKFIIKNYYQKPTYLMNDYTIKCLKEAYYEQNKTGLPFDEDDKFFCSTDDVQVIVNGHRYNLS